MTQLTASDIDVRFFMPIAKIDKKKQMVFGYASTPALDLDGEIVSKQAVIDALPGYMEWRNVREMHQPSAVGITKEAEVDEKGLYIGAKVVDGEAWAKCLQDDDGHAVYNGFSIGGKKLAKEGDTITKIELIEISLVDRPANPECRIEVVKIAKQPEPTDSPVTLERHEIGALGSLLSKLSGLVPGLSKRQFSDKERSEAAESGAALPDGSFPIHSKADLRNAITEHGRAKNKARAKRHIVRRAHALGLADELPEGWNNKPAEKLAKGRANLYCVGRMIELLGSLESCEEALEYEDGGYFGSSNVKIDKSLTDRFGSLLVEFADLTAEILDVIIQAMDDEETGERAAEKAAEVLSAMASAQAVRLSHLAEKLGTVVKVADTPTEDDDDWLLDLQKGADDMAGTMTPEMRKRVAAAHKASIMKAHSSLHKAIKLHEAGMSHLNKACATKAAMSKMSDPAALKKAGEEMHDHVMKAHGLLSQVADHHDIAAHHLGKVASGWVGEGKESPANTDWDHSDITERTHESISGDVPEYDPTEAYPGKSAEGEMLKALLDGKLMTPDMVKSMVEAAVATAKADIMGKMPIGGPRAALFSVDKTAFAGAAGGGEANAGELLMKDVAVDPQNPDSFTAAASNMIGNMLRSPRTFGRPLQDPSFKGAMGR